ncbi:MULTISPECIES: DUF2335 domain-containing protein [unclassified Synechocystis]|uniref:DUF2335 domain-containing protein n=1 Tax=unclassified Synechocystis TaxID=2640012 RepID=UPI00048C5139|nr:MULTISPECIES: DUF2335 domain-containing protein [unclassified Synechocystis]MCT0254521.1 DUF2335 domain-containing protein [Synechocystis sp. CS-94]
MPDDNDMPSQIEVSNASNKSNITEQIDSKIIQELIEDVSELKEILRQEVVEIKSIERRFYSGPIPPPEIIRGYEEVVQGSADRILKMTEKQLEHRIATENKQLDHSIKSETKLINNEASLSYLGLVAGFMIAMFGLSGAIYLGIKDKPVASASMTGFALVSLVSVFISGKSIIKKQSPKDNDLKENQDN